MPTTLAKPTAHELASNHFVYSEAMYHRDLQLHRGDIAEGIKAFRELTGQDVKLITLHPSNEYLADAISKDITVSYCGGVLKWMMWLAVGEIKPGKNGDNNLYHNSSILPHPINDTPPILVLAPDGKESPQVTTKRVGRGRHPKVFPEDTIRQLRDKGLNMRKIQKALKRRRVKISLMSISRILKGQRTLPIGN